MPIDRALLDKRLLGAALDDPSTWQPWRMVLKAAFGLTLNRDEAQAFASVAGGRAPPAKRVRELWCVAGRRSGKSRIAAALAIYFAAFVPHKLAAGERGMVLVLAASQEQARTVFAYVYGFLNESEALRKEIASTSKQEIRLRNGVIIAIHTNSFRTVRGRTLLGCVFDEAAFWRDETSVQPDIETYTAVLPSLATTAGMLIGISSPYRKTGLLHQKYRDHFGVDDDDVLVVQGASRTFNPLLTEAVIAALRMADPGAAASEWDAEFRTDISAFLDDELIDGAVEHGRPLELSPLAGNVQYRAFIDAAGGRGDAYTIAIAHREGEDFVVDAVRGTHPPFDPVAVTKEYAALLRFYGVASVTGDHYGAEWVGNAWRDCGIGCERCELTKSAIYLECLPLFARGAVRLPDHTKLLRELRLLERHTHRSGKDTISHGKVGSDDFCNAACGALWLLSGGAPALWRREQFLVEGRAAELPRVVLALYVCLVGNNKGELASAYFEVSRGRNAEQVLHLVDAAVQPLSPLTLREIARRMEQLASRRPTLVPCAEVFAQRVVADELERVLGRNVGARPIDYLLAGSQLGLSAASHITSGAVKVTDAVLALPLGLGFLDGVPGRDDDVLKTAVLAGIVAGFHGDSLTPARGVRRSVNASRL